MKTQSWWRGSKGEWYVVMQIVLFLLVAFGPRNPSWMPVWPAFISLTGKAVGAPLFLFGLVLVIAGIARLGSNLTALPYPKEDGRLIVSGAYSIVRHPMYGGAIFAAFGWGLWVNGILTLCYAALLFVFFDVKSRREELWLGERFPEYAGYRGRVSRLIPLVY